MAALDLRHVRSLARSPDTVIPDDTLTYGTLLGSRIHTIYACVDAESMQTRL